MREPTNQDLKNSFDAHAADDRNQFDRLNRAIFGEDGEKGMKDKVDDMYDILIQAQGIRSFFGGIKGGLGIIIVIGAAWTIIKSWIMTR